MTLTHHSRFKNIDVRKTCPHVKCLAASSNVTCLALAHDSFHPFLNSFDSIGPFCTQRFWNSGIRLHIELSWRSVFGLFPIIINNTANKKIKKSSSILFLSSEKQIQPLENNTNVPLSNETRVIYLIMKSPLLSQSCHYCISSL